MFFARILPALVCAGVALVTGPEVAMSADPPTVRYQEYPGSISHLVNWVAMEKGFCAKEGIKCEPVYLASGPLAAQAAAAGSLDIMLSTSDQILQSIAKGNDLQIIASQIPGLSFVFVSAERFPQPDGALGYPGKMQDFKTAKIGVSARGSGTEMIAKALLSGANVASDDASYIAVGAPPTVYPALVAGQIDAAVSWDPMSAICSSSAKCRTAVDMRKGVGPPEILAMIGCYNPWAARRDYIEKNGAAVDAFIRALGDAMAWLKDPKNHAEALALATGRFKLSDSIPNHDQVIEQAMNDEIGMFGTHCDRGAVKGVNDFLIKNKLIDKPLDPNVIVYRNAP